MKPLFQNLISNSLKYSKSDTTPEISISASIEPIKKDGISTRYCRIYIRDNGIGFDQSYADQVFTMFKRLHASTEYQGTGIGLTICKKIVEQHQGTISVSSVVNEGTTFIINLPAEIPANVASSR